MSTSNTSKHPTQRRYPAELRERAVRMVREATTEGGESFGVVTRVARQLGIGAESLRNWVKQAEVDGGQRPGVTTEERRRIAELERENRELRRANEILLRPAPPPRRLGGEVTNVAAMARLSGRSTARPGGSQRWPGQPGAGRAPGP
jgi:transposase